MIEDKVEYISADLIDLPEKQMRRTIDSNSIDELAENIKQNGLISPITIRPVNNRYELVAGQRRLLACLRARIIRIPCIIRDLTDESAIDIMAAENLERKDVDVIDESNFIKLVMETQNVSLSEMAKRLNRSEQYVRDRIAIAEMPDYLQSFLKTSEIGIGVALLLMEIEPDEKRRIWTGLAVEQNASVRTVDYWVYQHRLGTLPGAVSNPSDVPQAPDAPAAEPMFVCAVDGMEYPADQCRAVFIFKGNESVLNEFRIQLRKMNSDSELGGDKNAVSAAVAA
jgi:ParB family chromosome partitioning protein